MDAKRDAKNTGSETTGKVWLAPRDVKSAPVTTYDGREGEKFLFYRGVGHVDAPVRIVRSSDGRTLEVHDNILVLDMMNADELLRIHAAWLVDVRPDGTCAFQSLGAVNFDAEIRAVMPASFAKGDLAGGTLGYAPGNMKRLRAEMRAALIKEGLYADEADALLNTWQVSYFKSPGLRFFYLCPRVETDEKLPMEISVKADVTRVMVGRIEIVTPEQRALLAKIAAGPALDLSAMRAAIDGGNSDFFKHPENTKNWNDVMAGKKPYSALGLPIPAIYADYLKLGRFRNALILDEQKQRPTPALNDFITKNGFEAYEIK